MTVVRLSDCVDAGYCVKGARAHCKLLGLDFRRLARVGIPLEELEHFDDEIVTRCIEKAKDRETKNG